MSMEFYLTLPTHTLAALVLRLSKQNNEWRDIAIALGWRPEIDGAVTGDEDSVPMCPLCKTLRPEWCENFEVEGAQTLFGIPVCIPCADVITDYMIDLRDDSQQTGVDV